MEEDSEIPRGPVKGWWRPIVLFTIIFVFAVLGAGFGLGERVAGVRAWMQKGGAAAAALFVLARAGAAVAMLPGSVLSMAAGAFFGSALGVLYVSAGTTLGATVSFLNIALLGAGTSREVGLERREVSVAGQTHRALRRGDRRSGTAGAHCSVQLPELRLWSDPRSAGHLCVLVLVIDVARDNSGCGRRRFDCADAADRSGPPGAGGCSGQHGALRRPIGPLRTCEIESAVRGQRFRGPGLGVSWASSVGGIFIPKFGLTQKLLLI